MGGFAEQPRAIGIAIGVAQDDEELRSSIPRGSRDAPEVPRLGALMIPGSKLLDVLPAQPLDDLPARLPNAAQAGLDEAVFVALNEGLPPPTQLGGPFARDEHADGALHGEAANSGASVSPSQ